MDEDEKEAIHGFVNMMLANTLRLVDVEPRPEDAPEGTLPTASGILVLKQDRYFVLSAGHSLRKGKWVIETNMCFDPPKVVVLGIPEPQVFYNINQDFAWAEIDMKTLAARMKADPKWDPSWVELPYYNGPLNVQPDPKVGYGFASWKAVTFRPGINRLEREARYEVYMAYDGLDKSNGLYRFKLARKHQGDDYYRGCSGAPIAGPDGQIIALVSRGLDREDEGYIWGSPLANYADKIGVR